jgi:parvulin-like peptidyl-prolyl isomerase
MRIIFFFAIFLIVLGAKCSCGGELIDQVVAVVNGEIITQRQLDQVIFLTGGNLGMEEVIENFILCQEAKEKGISVSSETVEKALAEIKRDFSAHEFEQALSQSGLSVREYQEWLERKILRDRLWYQKGKEIDKKIRIKDPEIREFYLKLKKYLRGEDISEAQVSQFYRGHQKNLTNTGKVQIVQVIVKSKAMADAILQQLKKGESWAALARKFSLNNSIGQEGKLGWISLREIKPNLRAVILPLKEGEAIKVEEENEDFYRIIQLRKRKELDFKSCEREIEKYLKEEKKKKALQEWLKELMVNSEIRIIKK